MIQPIECFCCDCDMCDEPLEHVEGWTIGVDKNTIKDWLDNNGWHQAEDGKTYCDKCHHIDDEDNIVLHHDQKKNQGGDNLTK